MSSRVDAPAALAVRRMVEFAQPTSLIRGLDQRRAEKRAGVAAAKAWRESRRCTACGAIAYRPCAHRPEGAGGPEAPSCSTERMPFAGHRTCAEWR